MNPTQKRIISDNENRLHTLVLGIKSIGTLLHSAEEVSETTVREVGYLINEIGVIMNDTLNQSTEIENEIFAKNLKNNVDNKTC